MAVVVKVINFIVKRSTLTHWQFQSLLEEMDCTYKDIPLHSAGKWLSCWKFWSALSAALLPSRPSWLKKAKTAQNSRTPQGAQSLNTRCSEDCFEHVWHMDGFCQQASNLFMWCCYLCFLPLQTHQAVLATHHQHRWNMQVLYVSELESEVTTWFGGFQKYGPMSSFCGYLKSGWRVFLKKIMSMIYKHLSCCWLVRRHDTHTNPYVDNPWHTVISVVREGVESVPNLHKHTYS